MALCWTKELWESKKDPDIWGKTLEKYEKIKLNWAVVEKEKRDWDQGRWDKVLICVIAVKRYLAGPIVHGK